MLALAVCRGLGQVGQTRLMPIELHLPSLRVTHVLLDNFLRLISTWRSAAVTCTKLIRHKREQHLNAFNICEPKEEKLYTMIINPTLLNSACCMCSLQRKWVAAMQALCGGDPLV
jgi:hypothetical protein